MVLDERAGGAQREALLTLVSGRAGGPWKIIATTVETLHPPQYARYEVVVDGFASRARAGDFINLEMEPVRNKVTGAETHARVILPEGFVFREADLGASAAFRVAGPLNYDHTGRYAAAAPFEYQGP